MTGGTPIGAAAVGPLSRRYPDPAVECLDPSFTRYRLFSASVERLAEGFRWAEGPVWFGDGGYLLFSDIPNDRIVRWDERSGTVLPFRQPANFANGLTRDTQGRLVICEGSLTRRIVRIEHDGKLTVLADSFEGKPFNSPNDVVCQSNGAIWFTDPPFQIGNDYEGRRARQEHPHGVYRIDPSGSVTRVLADLQGPNGLCFSPDESTLYVVEGRAQPNRLVWAYSVSAEGRLGGKRRHIDAGTPAGALDGITCDIDGNIWAGWGSSGLPGVDPAPLDGVMVFDPEGKPIGHIHLPERCANLCFGGAAGNRLFMASSHALYALYVNTTGAGRR